MQFVLGLYIFLFGATVLAAVDFQEIRSARDITEQVSTFQTDQKKLDPRFLSYNPGKEMISLGYITDDLWLKLVVTNSSKVFQRRFIYFDSPLVGTVKTYELKAGSEELLMLPRDERFHLASFNIELEPETTKEVYLQISTHHTLNTKIYLSPRTEYFDRETDAKMIFLFYLGGIACLAIYNFVLGISTRRFDYLYYACFATTFAMGALTALNVIDTYIFPNPDLIFNERLMFFSSLALFTATFFVEKFLSIGRDFKIGFWGLRMARYAAIPTMLGSFFAPYWRELYMLGYWTDFSIAGALVFFIYCGLYSFFKYRNSLAIYFLVSWFAVALGVMTWILAVHGVIATTAWTQYSLFIANLGEMLILSLGLAYKIRVLDLEKAAALRAAADKDRYQRLVKVLSHDVANTVAGLGLHTEALHALCRQPEQLEHVSRLSFLSKRLHQILNAIRAEEVLNTAREHLLLEPVNLRDVCSEVLEIFNWELADKKIQLTLELPDSVMVIANRSALVNQVLVNIISNCIKFSKTGSQVLISSQEDNKEVRLLIADQGMGIPPERLSRFFERPEVFSSLGTSKEAGTGLGTKIVAEYMRLFGGKASVQSVYRSAPDIRSGTTVFLSFPKI